MTDRKLLEMFKRIKIIFPYTFKDYDEKDIVIWQSTWKELLSGYDDKAIDYAFKKVMSKAKQPPVPADIIEELENINHSIDYSDAELWDKTLSLINETQDLVAMFNYTVKEANGNTQGENARIKMRENFKNANPIIKEYIGSVSNLLYLTRLGTEELNYERVRFLKAVEQCRKRVNSKFEYNFLLLQGVEIKAIEGVKQ